MNSLSRFFPRHEGLLTLAMIALGVSQVRAASATWTGAGTDALWSNPANWSATPVPGTGDTATFTGDPGSGSAGVNIGSGVTVNTIVFSGCTNPFIIGAGAVNSQSLTLNATGIGGIGNGTGTAFSQTITFNCALILNNNVQFYPTVGNNPYIINGNITPNGTSGSTRQLKINGRNFSLNGLLSDQIGGAKLQISGANGNTAILTNPNNSFTGGLDFDNGTVSVTSIGLIGSNSAAGAGGPLLFGSGFGGGVLTYTGTGNTTDRVITLNNGFHGPTITQSGTSGHLKFTANVAAVGVGSPTMTLSGSTSGTGEIAGNIVDNATTGSTILKNQAANGATSIELNSVDGIEIGAAVTGTNITAGTTVTAVNPSTRFITISPGTTGVIAQGASLNVVGLVNMTKLAKSGSGTWTLSGNNTYSGPTTINQGVLRVSSLNNIATPSASSSLGRPLTAAYGTINIGNAANAGQLTYLGAGETTDRIINLAGTTGGAILDQSGTGLLKFTSAFSAPGAVSTDRRKTVTLQGSTSGTGEIASGIPDSTLGTAGQLATALTKSGSGTWSLTGSNSYSGLTTVSGGTLRLDANTGSLNSSSALTFGGSGRFLFDGTSASGAKLQTMGALTFSAGEGTLQLTKGSASSITVNPASLAARVQGATGNFVSGGTVDTDNKISFTTAPTAGQLIDRGFFFNGSEFAAYDAAGYLRALNYATTGGDTNTVNVGTITASRHVKLTSSPANQSSISLLSLNLAGTVNWTQNASQTLTTPAILKSGGGSSTVSGGTAVTTASNADLVIRTDGSSDSLTMQVPLTQGSGWLIKSGLGTLTLSATGNSYSGQTRVNAGTMQIDGTITGTGAVTVYTGATLGGNGSLAGAVTLQTGATIQPSQSGSAKTLTLASTTAPALNVGSVFRLRAPTTTMDRISSNATTMNITGADLVIDTTGLFGNVPSTTIVQNAGTITGPFRSVTVTGNTDYVATLDYSTAGQVKVALTNTLSAPTSYRIQVAGNSSTAANAGDAVALTVTALNPSGTALTTFSGDVSLSFYGLASSPNSNAPVITDKSGVSRAVTATVGTPNVSLTFVNGVATVSGANNGLLTAYHAATATLHCSDSIATSATGTGAGGLSLTVNPLGIQSYTVAASSPQVTSVPFTTTVTALDTYGNTVTTDSTTVVTMTSSGSAQFDSNGDSTFGDNTKTLIGGTFTISTKDDVVETITLTATSAGGKTGSSSAITFNPSSAKDILTFTFPGFGAAIINGTNITRTLPFGTVVTNLAPVFTISGGASSDPVSGTTRDFTTPQNYTITALDNSTKVYTVTVTVAPQPTVFTWASATNGNFSDATKWTNNVGDGTAPAAAGFANYTLNFNQSGTYTATQNLNSGFLLNQVNFSGAVTIDGTNSMSFTNNGATLPTINHNGSSSITISAPLTLAANTTIGGTAGGNVNLTLSGAISGTGSLIKQNASIVTLNTAGTYSGGTVVQSGNLRLGTTNNSLLGAGTVTVNSGASLSLNGNSNLTNTFEFNSATVSNGNSFSANINGPVAITGNNSFDLATTGNMSIGGTISGTGGIIKKGTSNGALSITGNNTFSGPVAIQAGTISVNSLNRVSGGTASSNLGAPTTAENGTISIGLTTTSGTLIYNGNGETTDRVIQLAGTTGGATITQGGNPYLSTSRGTSGLLKFTSDVSIPGVAGSDNRKTLTLTHAPKAATGSSSGQGEFSGSIGDSLSGTSGQTATSITKAGVGTWILSGANTYSGTTRVQAGTLAITRPDALGAGPLDISSGARMQLDYVGTRQVASLTYPNYSAAGSYGSSSSMATFKDDAYFSGPGTITIGALPTTGITLVRGSGSNPSNGGSAVTFTATVTGSSPTGLVYFYDGLNQIGAGSLNASAQASFTTSLLSGGSHTITAVYAGDTNNAVAYSAGLAHSVNDSRTSTTTSLALASGGNPSAFGSSVTFTASVTGSSPTGAVAFYDGSTLLGTIALNGSAQASLSTGGLAAGWRSITARYLGDANHAPSTTSSAHFQRVTPPTGNGKLKVFILAGQSNMQGKGRVEVGRDPNNYSNTTMVGGLGSLRNMLNKNPNTYGYLADTSPLANTSNTTVPGWRTMPNVWVSYFTSGANASATQARKGLLDADFGDGASQGRIGPEYAFGLTVGSQLGDPVLIIKTAWGGNSLAWNFRPPSSGSTTLTNINTMRDAYNFMVADVRSILNNLGTELSGFDYNPANGYEIAGFGWHQGWNDRGSAAAVAEYEANMVNLINDLRTEFAAPNMPVVIGTTSMANVDGDNLGLQLVAAQKAVALRPAFAGTVATIDTKAYDYGTDVSPSSEGFHWNWNAESYFNVGEKMGQAMVGLLSSQSASKNILSFSIPGQISSSISGNTITVTMPAGTDRRALVPSLTVSSLATALPLSGAARDFTAPQTYTVTAQNLSTQTYTVNIVESATTPYQDWASTNAPSGTSADDFDKDGVSNGIEFLLGGDKNTNDLSKLPTMTTTATHWVFRFRRIRSSVSGVSSCVIDAGSTLSAWPQSYTVAATTALSTPGVTIDENDPSDFDTVTLSIPKQGDDKKFARLRVQLLGQ